MMTIMTITMITSHNHNLPHGIEGVELLSVTLYLDGQILRVLPVVPKLRRCQSNISTGMRG